jgi:c-di-GMP-binding flagellar brake protein YcgR
VNAQVRLHGSEAWSGVYQTADLSATGAFLISDAPPPRGALVKLDLEVDEDQKLQDLQALVVHVRTDASEPSARGCGVMFVRMAKEQAESLRAVVAERLAR